MSIETTAPSVSRGVLKRESYLSVLSESDTNLSLRTTHAFIAQPVARLCKRDFCVLTVFSHGLERRPQRWERVREALTEWHSQLQILHERLDQPAIQSLEDKWLNRTAIDLHVTNATMASYTRGLIKLDAQHARILCAVAVSLLDKRRQRELLYPATLAYVHTKMCLMGKFG